MSSWLRPLTYVGLEVIPPGLLIVKGHPWTGAGIFVVVLAVSLVHSRLRTGADAARQRQPLSSVWHATEVPARVLRPVADSFRITADGEERPLRARDDQLIHFPPRRLPL